MSNFSDWTIQIFYHKDQKPQILAYKDRDWAVRMWDMLPEPFVGEYYQLLDPEGKTRATRGQKP